MVDIGSRLARLKGTANTRVDDASHLQAGAMSRPELSERLRRMRRGYIRQETSPRMDDSELAARLGGTPIVDGLIGFREAIAIDSRDSLDSDQCWTWWGHDGKGLAPVFLDTETTGLAGGTGTLAFLVGVATQQGGALELRQWLLTRFAAEGAMLRCMAAICTSCDLLVSYNGKSFDSPLLSTRHRLNGINDSLEGLPHLDVLHTIRRLWGRRWQNCRLATAESRLLGVTRHDDLPGAEAPDAWLSWIREGDFSRLIGVIKHNRQDLLSLASLPRAVWRAVNDPHSAAIDLAALAREHENRGEPVVARRLLHAHESSLEYEALVYLARLCRRQGHWQEAVRLWRQLAESGLAAAMTELAKYQEHRARDHSAALEWTRRAMGIEGPLPHHCHRERRLLRKLANTRLE